MVSNQRELGSEDRVTVGRLARRCESNLRSEGRSDGRKPDLTCCTAGLPLSRTRAVGERGGGGLGGLGGAEHVCFVYAGQ